MAGDSQTSLTSALPANAAELWRSPEEWAGSPEFQEMVLREFPNDADTWTDPVSRRQFMTLMGASMALAGVVGCSPRPASPQKVLPYTKVPEGMTPGIPMFFSSAALLGGYANGIIVKSHEGRPVKVEGNPRHPGSLGSTDVFAQASILDLYDPDRSQSTTFQGASRTWDDVVSTFRIELKDLKDKKEAGIRVLTETITSPSFHEQIKEFTEKYDAKWVQYEPANRDSVREGAKLAYGEYVEAIYDFKLANVVLALDADFLCSGPGAVRYSRDFMARRRVRENPADGGKAEEMNRLYSVEAMLTSTGAVADHRLPLKAGDVEAFTRALAAALNVPGAPSAPPLTDAAKAWIAPLVKELTNEKNKGKSIVIAGDHQSPGVHALVHAINAALGNVGHTVKFIEPPEARPENQLNGFTELVKEMSSGKVKMLFILGGNPVFNSPVDIDFVGALANVATSVHLGLYRNETAAQCKWHINEAHPLESWGDARAYDGTATILQPLIAPLYSGHTALELIAALAAAPDQLDQSGHEVVYGYWKDHAPKTGAEFDSVWEHSVRDGVVTGTASKAVDKKPDLAKSKFEPTAGSPSGIEVCFRIDPTIYDGRFANNGWLQELPKPVSKLCWDNAAIMSPKTATALGLSAEPARTAGERGRMKVQFVKLIYKGREVTAAAWPQPGYVDDSVTLYLGHGRELAGRVGNNTGFNTYKIRPSETPWTGSGIKIENLNDITILACTQAHHSMDDRKPVRRLTPGEMADKNAFIKAMEPAVASGEYDLIKANVPGPHQHEHDHDHDHGEEGHQHEHDKRLSPLSLISVGPPGSDPANNHRWAMAIDLTSCTGCNVCMIACMAENNIPVIGKHEVTRAREMYWIRVDRYFVGDPDNSEGLKTYFQPVPCQQCEKAPCEIVCPVGATTHSTDGLNDMVYNRCVGTRYCSNNCPYKVRRFNFLTYADWVSESLKLGRNPEVTVRSRGVMEKCTYCVQRIRLAEITAEREWAVRPKDANGRPMIKDGEIVTACQAACPSQAIVFGDLGDVESEKKVMNPATGAWHQVKGSEVNRWKAEPTNYGLLAELNTMPRTTYLATVRNPNPDMPKGA